MLASADLPVRSCSLY